MPTVYDVKADELIKRVSEKLKSVPEIKPPEQLQFWKTAYYKEIAPVNIDDFWYIRSASLLRKVYLRKNIGINKLRREYGGRTRNHVHKKHFAPAGGAIIRRCLQQLEKAGLVQTVPGKGRIITPKGASFLDKTAMEIYKEHPIQFYSHIGLSE